MGGWPGRCWAGLAAVALVLAAGARGAPAEEAVVSALFSDHAGFLSFAVLQAEQLRALGMLDRRDLVMLTTPLVSERTRLQLEVRGWILHEVPVLAQPFPADCARHNSRRQLRHGFNRFNKIYLWALTMYRRVVFLDSDVLPLRAFDDLFARPTRPWPSAALDLPVSSDHFNAGVMVVEPDAHVARDMETMVFRVPSYDCGDQGFLNAYFWGWHNASAAHLLPATDNYIYNIHFAPPDPALWDALVDEIRLLHYAGLKPWQSIDGDRYPEQWAFFQRLHREFHSRFGPAVATVPGPSWDEFNVDAKLHALVVQDSPVVRSPRLLSPEFAKQFCSAKSFNDHVLAAEIARHRAGGNLRGAAACSHRLALVNPTNAHALAMLGLCSTGQDALQAQAARYFELAVELAVTLAEAPTGEYENGVELTRDDFVHAATHLGGTGSVCRLAQLAGWGAEVGTACATGK